jgi:hypothetical protein
MMGLLRAEPVAGSSEVTVRLAGVELTLRSNATPFLDYAARHLAPVQQIERRDRPLICARLRWHECAPLDRDARYPQLRNLQRLDRDLYRGEGVLYWFRVDELPDLHLVLSWNGVQLRIEADYYHRLSNVRYRDAVKRAVYRRRLPELRRRRFTTLLHYLVYYPIFWYLEHDAGFHPIHAGGVEIDGKTLVFAGPSGVGKSTLVSGLGTAPGIRMLSDTFLLQRGTELLAVPEPLLLDEWSRHWLGKGAAALQPLDHRYCLGRRGFHCISPEHLAANGTACAIVFPQRSSVERVRVLPPDEARGRVRAGDLMVNDLRRYWGFAAIMESLRPRPLISAREASLARLTGAVPAMEVGLTRDLDRVRLLRLARRLAREARTA